MHFPTIALLACIAVVSAGLLPEKSYMDSLELENDSHPSYEFAYNVDDTQSGDVKTQRESRDGENVKGQYTLNDADGYKRIVDYSVNGESGFTAVVRRERLTDTKNIEVPKPIVTTTTTTTTTKKPVIPSKQLVNKARVQPPAFVRTTVVHHHQTPTVYHAAPAVHLGHTAHHIVHTAPTTTVLKSSPAVITTHHHTPAVVHHHTPAVIHHAPAASVVHHAPAASVVHHHTPSLATPHQVSYVHYH